MWRRRRLFRVTVLCTLAFFVIYIITAQQHTFRYKNRRKLDFGRTIPVVLVNELTYIAEDTPSESEDKYARHAFNIVTSNKMKSNRPVPDTRHHRCQEMDYNVPDYESTSVIITFHNEARSTLLRTVVSVLNRTPYDTIADIILVDDFSDNAEDGFLLTSLPKVRLLRNDKREGLIRSRIRGAEEAKGDFLMFLDSHCEVNVGWLEPLLAEADQDPTSIVCPVIDVIDSDSFEYRPSSSQLKGGFDWGLHFKWIPMTEEEKAKRESQIYPFMSPVIPGGLFLVKKQWFLHLGAFDPDLNIWGGENLEISLKTWLCGGKLKIVPCSRIGHVFRKRHPYSFPEGNSHTYLRNTKRIADVWLDEYKRFFYEAKPHSQEVSIGSIEERIALKTSLNCKPFGWYLENVYPELRLPNEESTAYGHLKQGSLCLQPTDKGQKLKVTLCTEQENFQNSWFFNEHSSEIRHNNLCLTLLVGNRHPLLKPCKQDSSQQKWSRHSRAIVHTSSGKCLEADILNEVIASNCRRGAMAQQWDFTVELQAQDSIPVSIV